jgi:hypothetical protein
VTLPRLVTESDGGLSIDLGVHVVLAEQTILVKLQRDVEVARRPLRSRAELFVRSAYARKTPAYYRLRAWMAVMGSLSTRSAEACAESGRIDQW